MDDHMGYENYERSTNSNYRNRNGTKSKKVRSNYVKFEIKVPQNWESSFKLKVVKKLAAYVIIGINCEGMKDVISL